VEIDSAKGTATSRTFELSGGHPALDLVNTLDWRFRESGPQELLETYEDVVRFTEQSGLISAADARKLLRHMPDNKAARVLAAVRHLRESAADALYGVVEGKSPSSSTLKQLKKCIEDARQQQEFLWNGDTLEWVLPHSGSLPALPLWLLSLSMAALMTSDQMRLVRQCGSAECRWLFVDTSKNHTRRWCNMKICGNRMKARRFKAQHNSCVT
jgi:predicted RNA-binding Zn ribbon-like protein